MCFTNVSILYSPVLYIDRFNLSMYYILIDLGVTRVTNVCLLYSPVLNIDRFSLSMYYIAIDLGVTRVTNVLYVDWSM